MDTVNAALAVALEAVNADASKSYSVAIVKYKEAIRLMEAASSQLPANFSEIIILKVGKLNEIIRIDNLYMKLFCAARLSSMLSAWRLCQCTIGRLLE
jgi:hypothetical protein